MRGKTFVAPEIKRLHLKKRLLSHSGIVLPLSLFIITVVMTFVVVLGIESAVVKWASLELKAKTESVCRFVAESSLLQRQAVYLFQDELRDLNIWNTRLVQARLIIPTMPEHYSLATEDEDSDYTCANCQPAIAGRAQAVSDLGLGLDGCRRENGHDVCLFQGDVHPAATDIRAFFPDALLHNRNDAGVTTGCVIEGQVELPLSPSKKIIAVSAWWRPVRAGTDPNFGLSDDPSAIPAHYRGLTLAIATHLTTFASDPRFRFTGIEEGRDLYSADFRRRFDPLWMETPWSYPAGRTGFSQSVASQPVPLGQDLRWPAMSAISAEKRSFPVGGERTALPPFENGYGDRDDLILSDREEMAVACINPLVLVRNIFLATILELAARHAHLRSATEVLHVGTSHRIIKNPANKNSLPIMPNTPSVVVPFGSDLMRQDYQVPYVFYHSGNDTQTPAEFLPHKGGWINPFSNNSGVTEELRQHQAYIASQLRACYHLFYGTNASPPGLERYGIRGELPFTEMLMDNLGFEPAIGSENGSPTNDQAFYRRARARIETYPGSDPAWEQGCAWDNDQECNLGVSRRLRATEITSVLGSTQSCPFYHGGVVGMGTCNKPQATNDLRPDLIGLLSYVAMLDVDTTLGVVPKFPALVSPGLFPVLSPNKVLPLAEGSSYTRASNVGTALIVVLHKPLSSIEIDALEALSTTSAMQGRPIRLVYFPSSQGDYSEGVVNDLKTAFNITYEDEDLIAKGNYPRVFSPYLKDAGGDFIYPQFTEKSDALNHRDYWHYLLTDPDKNIVRAAKDYFYTVILRLEVKF